MPPGESLSILGMLAQSVAKLNSKVEHDKEERKQAIDTLEAAVVCNHLKKVSPQLAKELMQELDISSTTLTLHELLRSWHSRNDPLILTLVHRHLKQISPLLALELRLENSGMLETSLTLQEVIKVWNERHLIKKKPTLKDGAKNTHVNRCIAQRFTPEEDQILLVAMQKYGDKINPAKLSKQLGRDKSKSAVLMRLKVLTRTKGVHVGQKSFTVMEDLVLIDNIVPMLKTTMLEEVVVTSYEPFVRQQFPQRDPTSVMRRWSRFLQPYLLQHYAGTLNLSIDRMLANHILDTYNDFADINWVKVAARPEFRGHTINSLKGIHHSKLKRNATTKFDIPSREITLKQVAEYANETFAEGKSYTSDNLKRRQRAVIDHFLDKVDQLGLKDFRR